MRSQAMAAGAERLLVAHELLVVAVLTAATFCSIPLWHGGMELGWDALNHHIYLGWTAEHPRFDQDFLAASSQSIQFPYLYWPAYKLAASGASGVVAGLTLSLLQSLIAMPAWLLARACIPGRSAFDAAMRMLAVLLSLMTSAILLLVNTTSVDVIVSIPMLWAMALAAMPLDAARPGWLTVRRSVALSGVAAGVAVAAKLSNAPLAIVLPLLWLCASGAWKQRLANCVLGGLAMAAAFAAAYGYWGVVMWRMYGNPVYPLLDGAFAAVRALVGWQP